MTAKSPQVSVFFPDHQLAALKADAARLNLSVAAYVREAVAWRLHGPAGLASLPAKSRTIQLGTEPEPEPSDLNERIMAIIGRQGELEVLPPTVVGADGRQRAADGSPIALPLEAVTSQRQGERCYHLHADGVTRWHLDTIPCPGESNWAARLAAADLSADINGNAVTS